jgi:hypothetical protein
MADDRPILQFPDVTDESARDRLCRLVRFAAGWSLSNGRDKLSALVGRGVDAPGIAVAWKTNCGTTALGFVALACGTVVAARAVHALLATPSQIGKAIAWLSRIGDDRGAWVTYSATGPQPRAGDLLWYWNHPTQTKPDGSTETKFDDHVEWALSDVEDSGAADHGGGGRPNNEITVARGDVRTNAGRALRKFLDLDKLGIVPAATRSAAATDTATTSSNGTEPTSPDASSPSEDATDADASDANATDASATDTDSTDAGATDADASDPSSYQDAPSPSTEVT